VRAKKKKKKKKKVLTFLDSFVNLFGQVFFSHGMGNGGGKSYSTFTNFFGSFFFLLDFAHVV
jgi:hypothetical protein